MLSLVEYTQAKTLLAHLAAFSFFFGKQHVYKHSKLTQDNELAVRFLD